jgi:hypothetical protein
MEFRMAKTKCGPRKGSVHLDKRVNQILADPAGHGKDDDLLTTREMRVSARRQYSVARSPARSRRRPALHSAQ